MQSLDFLNSRHSMPARQLGEPGPDDIQMQQLLSAAIRVPDHGKLTPWRLLLIRGEERAKLGERLARIHKTNDPETPPSVLNKDRERYTFAPLIIAVIARTKPDDAKVPVQEQILSAGCVAYNLLLGAHALGFGAQWLTGWAAYDAEVASLLKLSAQENIIAFVHIGTMHDAPLERTRPALNDLVSEWHDDGSVFQS
jgi:nitroreductase